MRQSKRSFADGSEASELLSAAAAQVEDLMLSACNTGQLGRFNQYHAMFARYLPESSGGPAELEAPIGCVNCSLECPPLLRLQA